jgi:DNA-binding transcriptional ArsR family regulator
MSTERSPQDRRDELIPEAGMLRTARQFDAISLPIRDQLLSVIGNHAACRPGEADPEGISIAEMARQLGRTPSSLYRHLAFLVDAGLVREVGTRTSGGRDAVTYAAASETFALVTPKRQGAAMEALCRYLERMAAHAGREAAEATRDRARAGDLIGPHDQGSTSMAGWLDEAQRKRLIGLLFEMDEIFQGARRRPGTRLMAATMFIRPGRLPGGGIADDPPRGNSDGA